MVRALGMCCVSQDIRGLRRTYAQSIIGATLKRRDGSGRVVVGLEPVLAVISFNVFGTGCWILRRSSKLQGAA